MRLRDLACGVTVIRDCPAAKSPCPWHADQHSTAERSVEHELTLMDFELHDGMVSAICCTESGQQDLLYWTEWTIVRVYADTVQPA